jgi:hypothetical protein
MRNDPRLSTGHAVPLTSPWMARIRPRYRGLLITREWLMLPAGMHRDRAEGIPRRSHCPCASFLKKKY